MRRGAVYVSILVVTTAYVCFGWQQLVWPGPVGLVLCDCVWENYHLTQILYARWIACCWPYFLPFFVNTNWSCFLSRQIEIARRFEPFISEGWDLFEPSKKCLLKLWLFLVRHPRNSWETRVGNFSLKKLFELTTRNFYVTTPLRRPGFLFLYHFLFRLY